MNISVKAILLLYIGSLMYLPTFGQEEAGTSENEKKATDTLIKSIYFGGGSSYISDDQIEEMRRFLTEIENIYEYIITIHSHTDNIGGKEYNEWLSQMRSESVLMELIEQNVPSENIFIRDFGQNNPIFDNYSWDGRRKNRRVDVIFEKVVM